MTLSAISYFCYDERKSEMNRKSVTVILGGAVIGIMIMLAIYMGLIVTGVIDTRPSELVIVANSAEKEYDGQPLECHEYTIKSGELQFGHSIEASFDASLTGVGSCENVMQVKIVDTRGADVTNHYRLETRPGALTVVPCKLVVKSGDAQKAFDGRPLTLEEWSIVTGKLPEGIRSEATFTGSQETPGSSKNNFVLSLTNSDREPVDRNFSISYIYGTLKVTKRSITVTSHGSSKIYDGEPLIYDSYIMDGELADGHYLRVDFPASQTDVGSTTNLMSIEVYSDYGNVTSYYDVNVRVGKLEVKQRPIEISVLTPIIRNFHGDVLPEGVAEITRGTLAMGHELDVNVQAVPNAHDTVEFLIRNVSITDSYGRDVTSNYDVKLVHAVDSEQQTELVLSSADKSDIYTGEALTCEEYTIKSGKLGAGHIIEPYFTGSQTEIGFSDNTFTVVIIDQTTGEDVTYRYSISYDYGTLQVYESKPLTGGEIQDDGSLNGNGAQDQDATAANIWTESAGKVYLRWKSYGNYSYRESTGNWGWGDAMAYPLSDTNMLYTVGQALAADGKNPISYTIEILGNQYLLPNYVAQGPEGALNDTVLSPSETTYMLSGYQWTYNYMEAGAYALLGLENAQMLAYTEFVNMQYTSVPASTKAVLLELAAANGIKADRLTVVEDVAAFIRTCATYNMDFPACPAGQDEVVYFLTESKSGVCRHFASAATLMYRALGLPARYVVGYSTYAVADEWTEVKGEDAHAWVEVFIPGFGWVRVDPTPAASSGGSSDGDKLELSLSKVLGYYTGEEYKATEDNVIITQGSLKQGHKLVFGEGAIQGKQTNAGKAVSSIDTDCVRIEDASGTDVTSEYHIVVKNGIIEVKKPTLIITASSAKKKYDGQPLTSGDYTVTFKNAKFSDLYKVTFTGVQGQQTEVGTSENVVSDDVVITDWFGLGSDITENFEIRRVAGTLTVYMYDLSITTESASKTYDGIPMQKGTPDYDAASLSARGHRLVYTMPSLTNAGSISNTPSCKVLDSQDRDVTAQYDIRINAGTLRINPVYLTVQTASATKKYDGTPLYVDEFTIESGKLVSGQTIVSYRFQGSQTNVGSCQTEVTEICIQNAEGQDVSRNYHITILSGTLTVTAP